MNDESAPLLSGQDHIGGYSKNDDGGDHRSAINGAESEEYITTSQALVDEKNKHTNASDAMMAIKHIDNAYGIFPEN